MNGGPESGTGEGGFRARAGTLTLLYLASPVERSILLTLLAEATTGVKLLEGIDLPAPDDPIELSVLADPYLVEPADPDHEPGAPIDWETKLRPTPAGRELPFVAFVLERWLNSCPYEALRIGPDAGPELSAFLTGWSATVTHALAAKPLTPQEVSEAVVTLDQDIVEARLEEMEYVGHLELLSGEDGEMRYAVTDWLRMGIAPLAAAARMEHRHPPGDTAPIAALDVQAAFLLTLRLLELPKELRGSCSLAVELDKGVSGSPAGVTARIEGGRVVSCEVGFDEDADAWAAASAGDWLDTVIEADVHRVRTSGDRRLAGSLLQKLHQTLFGIPLA